VARWWNEVYLKEDGGGKMWQRFTERARRVVFFAQEEAARLGENYVGTEHLLLGLVREEDSVAGRLLHRLEISPGRIRSEIEKQVTRGSGNLGQDMQLTPRAKRVIDLAYEEARSLNNNYIGTEHLLLGLIGEEDGLGGKVLRDLGATLEQTRQEVRTMQEAEAPLALMLGVKTRFQELLQRGVEIPPEVLARIKLLFSIGAIQDPEELTRTVAPYLKLEPGDQQALSAAASAAERLEKLGELLKKEAVTLEIPRTGEPPSAPDWLRPLNAPIPPVAAEEPPGEGRGPADAGGPPVGQWTYTRVTRPSPLDLDGELEGLGRQGWELVSVIFAQERVGDNGQVSGSTSAFLKRPAGAVGSR
jgi:hypothetical protein